jgi:periplasmic protein TonB
MTNLKRSVRRGTVSVVFGLLALAVALAQERPIRVGGNVAQANRISSVAPVYPAEAKEKGIQGTVTLEVTIDKEGHVSQATATGGPAELIQSATDAVRQWLYRPTLLNGEPVTVLTTVNVNYTLSQ